MASPKEWGRRRVCLDAMTNGSGALGCFSFQIGLAICYDMRFPELSLALAQAGAEILTYPSAFGSVTGPAHWEVKGPLFKT